MKEGPRKKKKRALYISGTRTAADYELQRKRDRCIVRLQRAIRRWLSTRADGFVLL